MTLDGIVGSMSCGDRVSRSTSSLSAGSLAILLLAGCGDAGGPAAAPVTGTLDEVFAVESVIQLGEDPVDSIAEIGVFVERRDNGYVIGDRHLPRVRTYDEEGRLEAAFGRFGDGPFELQRITAVAEARSGKVVVASSRQSHLTYLTPSLTPDTMVGLPAGARDIFPLGRDLLVRMNAGDPEERLFSHPPLLHRVTPPELVWSSFELPFSPSDRPYWASFAPFPIAVSGDTTFVMSGVRYPITVIDGSGESMGTLGTPSASFRPIRVLESGALANLGSYGTTLPGLLASFDVIDRIDVVGTRLILTRARFDPERPMPPFQILHTSLEVYDRRTGTKLYEDVPLPDGSRVLGGGRFLYLLLDMHAPPWRIAKLRFRGRD